MLKLIAYNENSVMSASNHYLYIDAHQKKNCFILKKMNVIEIDVSLHGPVFALICSDSAVFCFLVQEILLDYSVLVGFVCLSAVRPLYSLSFVCTSYSRLSLASLSIITLCCPPLIFPSVKLTQEGSGFEHEQTVSLPLTAGLMPRIRFAWLVLFC